jgi:hypothetical protein
LEKKLGRTVAAASSSIREKIIEEFVRTPQFEGRSPAISGQSLDLASRALTKLRDGIRGFR